MKLDYLKDRKEFISMVLLGVSAFLGVLILIKVTGFFVTSASAKSLVKDAAAQSKLDSSEVKKYFAEPRAIADALKKGNLFVPASPKRPVEQVSGILGDEVLINGKWYKVGDMVGEAKIVAIEPAQIRIEWEGKEIALAPINSVSASEPGRKGAGDKKGPERERGRAEMVRVPRPTPGRGEGREGMRGMLRDISPEERDGLRERFRNMSDEERERFMGEMRERFAR